MKTGLLVLVVLCLFVSVCQADGLITVDPNQPGDTRHKPVDSIDPRLAQKITYSAKAMMVSEILDELSKMTGVTLNAGYNKQDWQVRDRKMVIFVTDLPLGELMNSIARVMKFNWSKNIDADPPTYRLYMNRELLLESNKLLREQEQKLKQENAALRVEQIEKMLNADKMTPEEIDEAKEANPRLYIWNKIEGAQPLRELLSACPEMRDALLSGDSMITQVPSLSEQTQSAMSSMIDALVRYRGYMDPDFRLTDVYIPADACIAVNGYRPDIEDDPVCGRYYLGVMEVYFGSTGLGLGIPNPEDLNFNVTFKMDIIRHEKNLTPDEAWDYYAEELDASYVELISQDKNGEPLIEHPEDSELESRVRLVTEKHYLHDYQEALAKETSFSIVSDCFPFSYGWPVVSQDELMISEVLQTLQDGFHYNWERYGSVLEFRDRYWYRKRSEQIPETWAADWRRSLKETGTLTFDQLVQISRLTPGQYWTSIHEDDMFNMRGALSEYVVNSNSKALFGAYLSLNSDGRKMLFSDNGLTLDVLQDDVWPVVKRLAITRPEYFDYSPGDIRLRIYKKNDAQDLCYCFSFCVDDVSEPLEMMYRIPRYEWSRKYQEEQREKEKNKQQSEVKDAQPILPTSN